jgi:hypothetical protein
MILNNSNQNIVQKGRLIMAPSLRTDTTKFFTEF